MGPEWLLWLILYSLGSRMETTCARVRPLFLKARDAEIRDYPFVVHIAYHGAKWNRTCAGTIATLSLVVSTSGCFGGFGGSDKARERGEYFTIHGGSSSHVTNETQTRNTSKVSFVQGLGQLNIGVGELEEPFEESPTLAPYKFPFRNRNEYRKSWAQMVKSRQTNCSLIGWGYSKKTEILKAVQFFPAGDCVETKDQKEAVCEITGLVKSGLVLNNGSGYGMPIMCGDALYGQMRPTTHGDPDTFLFIPFWPFIDRFDSSETLKSPQTTTKSKKPKSKTTKAAPTTTTTATTTERNEGTTAEITEGTDDLWRISGGGNEGGSWLIFPVALSPLVPLMPRVY